MELYHMNYRIYEERTEQAADMGAGLRFARLNYLRI